jgi:hypothetical protein
MMTREPPSYRGDDKLLFGIILGVLAFWLFAQTTLNIAPAMAADLAVPTNVMNIAVSITALFSVLFVARLQRPDGDHRRLGGGESATRWSAVEARSLPPSPPDRRWLEASTRARLGRTS